VPQGPVHPSTVRAIPLPQAAMPQNFAPRRAAAAGVAPVTSMFERWQIGVMQYSEMPRFVHSLQRAMALVGELEPVHVEHLFLFP
jgi:hypothetical protein